MHKYNAIIDCDPGCDDVMALIAALSSPAINVKGITTTYGNVGSDKTHKNASFTAVMMGRKDLDVYQGAEQPLLKTKTIDAASVHGETGVAGLQLPLCAEDYEYNNNGKLAAYFIINSINSAYYSDTEKELNLIVMGPLTNIAMAYRMDPTIADKVGQVVVMGGAFGNPNGNITDHAEFNIYCDPHSADIVFRKFKDIKLVPLDTTHQFLVDREKRIKIASLSKHGANLANMFQQYAITYPGFEHLKSSPVHDLHTVGLIEHPNMYTTKKGSVSVNTFGVQEGNTTFTPSENGNIEVAFDVNEKAFSNYFLQSCMRGVKQMPCYGNLKNIAFQPVQL